MIDEELHQVVQKYRFSDDHYFIGWGKQTEFPKELVSICSNCCIYDGIYVRAECLIHHKHGKGIPFCPKKELK